MLPSLSATKPWGPESRVFSGYSLNSPVFGSSRPSLFAPWPVYQSEPSGASAGSCGRDRGVGTSYSLISTFRVPTVANPASVATNTNGYSLRRGIGASLRENCSPSFRFFPSRDRPDWIASEFGTKKQSRIPQSNPIRQLHPLHPRYGGLQSGNVENHGQPSPLPHSWFGSLAWRLRIFLQDCKKSDRVFLS